MAEVILKITGDSGSASAAVQAAQERYERAAARAAQVSDDLNAQNERLAQARMALDQATTAEEARNAQRRLDTQQKALERLERAHETAVQRMQDRERGLTRTVEREQERQASARRQAIGGAAGALAGGLIGGPAGSLIGGLAAAANPALAAAAAASAAASAIRAGLDAWKEQITVARDLAQVLGSTVQEASLWAAIAQQMGVSTDALQSGMRNLSEAIVDKPEAFKALGVALKDTDGSARPLIDIFKDVQEVLAGAEGGTLRNKYAQELFGRSMLELLPLLGATKDEIAAYAQIARASGEIVDNEAVASQKRWEAQTNQLGVTMKNFAQTVVGAVAPTLINALRGLGQAFDTLGTIVRDSFANLFLSGGGIRNPFDVIGEAMDAAQRRADETYARLERVGEAVTGIGGAAGRALPAFPKVGSGTDPRIQATQDAIQAIRDEADARQQQLRDGLEAFSEERDARLATLDAQRKAREKELDASLEAVREEAQAKRDAADAEMRQLRDGIQQRERARDREITAIQDAQQAAREAFDERERLRQREIAGIQQEMALVDAAFAQRQEQRDAEAAALNARLRAMDAVDTAAERARKLEEARAAVSSLEGEPLIRIRSESLSEFEGRVAEHNEKLAAARQSLAETEAAIAKEEAREEIQGRIDALQEASAADRKQVDGARKAAQERIDAIEAVGAADRERTDQAARFAAQRIDAIQREAKADRERTTDALALISDRAAAEQDAYAARIKQISAQKALETEAFAAARTYIEEEKAAEKKRVDDAIEGIQRETQVRVDELEKQLQAFRRKVSEEAAAFAGSSSTRTMTTIQQTIVTSLTAGSGGSIPKFAHGGELLITEPAVMVGLNSGRALAIAGEAGAEPIYFGGAGGAAGAREVVIPLTVQLDGRVIARSVSRHQADRYALKGGRRRRG